MSGTDSELLQRWIAGRDSEAFAEIVTRHSSMVYGICRRILGNGIEAQDVTQECFIALTQLRKTISESLAPWLYVVATRRCLDVLKVDKRRQAREKQFATDDTVSPDMDWQDVQQYVDEAIANLPDKLRMPLIRHFLEGRKRQEIARELGIPRTTLNSRIEKGIEDVRRALKKQGISILSAVLTSMLVAEQSHAVPPAVTAALGKLAISGGSTAVVSTAVVVKGQGLATSIATGGLVMTTKKIIVFAVICAILVLGSVKVLPGLIRGTYMSEVAVPILPQTEASRVTSTVRDNPDKEASPVLVIDEQSLSTPDENLNVALVQPSDALPEKTPKSIPETAIRGVVIDLDNNPVDGAQIILKDRSSMPELAAETSSEAEGKFVLTVQREGSFAHLSAYKKGLGFAHIKWVETGRDDIVLRLGTAGGISGHVLGAIGSESLPDVQVQLIDPLQDSGGPTAVTTSDASGAYTFPGLAIAKSYVIRAFCPGFAMGESAPVEMREAEYIRNVDVYLEQGHSIYGTVVDSAKRGLGDLQVDLSRAGGHMWTTLPSLNAITSSDGSFTIRNVPSGEYLPSVLTAATTKVKGDAFTMPSDDDIQDLVIVIGPGVNGFISGTVRDTRGDPIRRVEIVAYSGSVFGVAQSDRNGSYRIEGLGGGDVYELEVKGFRTGHGRERRGDIPVNSEGVDFVLRKSGNARGKVIDAATGKPIRQFEARWDSWTWREFTSETGEFELNNIEREEVILEARAVGYAPSQTERMRIADGELVEDVVIELKRGREVIGVILDSATGQPLEGARVRTLQDFSVRSEGLRGTAWGTTDPMTDAEGRFQLGGISEEGQYLLAWKQGYAPFIKPLDAFQDNQEIVVGLGSGGSATGATYDGDQALGNCPIIFNRFATSEAFGYHAFTASSGTGEFRFKNLPAGHYTVVVFRTMPQGRDPQPDWISHVEIIENQVSDFAIRFESCGAITGQVAGLPDDTEVQISVFSADDSETIVEFGSDDQGKFEFSGIPEGDYIIRAYTEGEDVREIEQRISIDSGQTTEVTLILEDKPLQ